MTKGPGGTLHTPLGPISVTETCGLKSSLDWRASIAEPTPLTAEALRQLQAWFTHKLTRFDLPLDFGTGFPEQVRRAMFAIPHGETRTYGDLARTLNAPAQAIGRACGANRVPILIPSTASSAPTPSAASRPKAALRPKSGS